MADISSITLPGGGTYNLKDKNAVPKYGMGKNLLRNWYFVGGGTGRGVFPVNQRGTNSAVQSSVTFVMDGWLVAYGSGGVDYSLASEYFEFGPHNSSSYATLGQALDSSMTGKTLTASILLSNGTLLYGTATVTGGDDYFYNAYPDGKNFRLYLTGGNLFMVLRKTASVQIVAVKLELGSEQTLCHNEGTDTNPVWVLNEVPDYEQELLKCQTSTADSTDTYANKTLATEQQLAYVETGTTASRNYTAGEYICWNGLLYTADTAIASGATLYTSGGNKNLTECVGGGFNDVTTFTVTPSSGVTINSQSNYKIGNLVFLYFEFTISSNLAAWTPVCTLPFPAFFGAFYLAASGAMPVSQVLYSPDNYTVSKGRNALPAGVYLVSVMGHIPR